MTKDQKVTKRLFSLWKFLFFTFSLGSSIYMAYLEAVLEMNVRSMPSVYMLILIAIIVCFFIPFLLLIRKRAVEQNLTEISKNVSTLLLICVIVSIGTLLANLLELVFPGINDKLHFSS